MDKYVIAVLAGFTLLVGTLVFGIGKDPNGKDIPLQDMPAFTGQNVFAATQTVDNTSIGKGVVLVNFWQTECGACMAEHPELMSLKDKVKIVGIAWFEKGERVKRKLNRIGNPYASVLVDGGGQVGTAFGIAGTPTTFLFKDGKKVWEHIGEMKDDFIEEKLLPHLAGEEG